MAETSPRCRGRQQSTEVAPGWLLEERRVESMVRKHRDRRRERQFRARFYDGDRPPEREPPPETPSAFTREPTRGEIRACFALGSLRAFR